MLVITNGTIVLPDGIIQPGTLVCRGGRILSAVHGVPRRFPGGQGRPPHHQGRPPQQIDARGGFITPGFVDIHVHGGAGADFMDGTPEAVRTALRAHARHGTTTIFPTTTTGSPKQIEAMLRACKSVQQSWTAGEGARIAGVHFYGPYFAEDKAGCHSKRGCREPDPREYARCFALKIIRIATCAAELPGALEFYRAARRRRCLVTCGHSNASWSEMARAFAAGMRHVDHFWCAMSSVPGIRARLGTPMQGSMEQFVLAHMEMSTEVIADGCHLAPELLEFAFRMIGPQRLCLVTDSNRALDMPPGKYRFGPRTDGEIVISDGKVGRQPGGGLASSISGMDAMVRNMKNMTGASVAQTIRMASLTPAERAGIARECGSLEPGKRADILILDRKLNLRRVFIGGVPIGD